MILFISVSQVIHTNCNVHFFIGILFHNAFQVNLFIFIFPSNLLSSGPLIQRKTTLTKKVCLLLQVCVIIESHHTRIPNKRCIFKIRIFYFFIVIFCRKCNHTYIGIVWRIHLLWLIRFKFCLSFFHRFCGNCRLCRTGSLRYLWFTCCYNWRTFNFFFFYFIIRFWILYYFIIECPFP